MVEIITDIHGKPYVACEKCGDMIPHKDAYIGPDPFLSEVWDEQEDSCYCDRCYNEALDEI